MGNCKPNMQRKSAGFTLMELLFVVAILIIAIAITAPALAPILRSTEINRLDNYAKEMYVAVQDQFITMEASGEYQAFNGLLEAEMAERNLAALGAQPHDSEGSAWRNYYYVQNGQSNSFAQTAADQAFAQVVARTSVIEGLTRGGRYIVEVNPRADGTDVYAVFYSEDPAFSYNDVINLASRSRSDRYNTGGGYPVGYYCGATASAPEFPDHFSPRASFINGEELFLKLRCAGGVGLVGQEQNMQITIELSDGHNAQTITLLGGQDFSLNPNGSIDVDILFDSMREGMHLSDLFPAFEPGADITATVEVLYSSGDRTISTPASAKGQAKANGLYASRKAGVVEVANVRHMNNLRLLPAETTLVNQIATIQFDATQWGTNDTTELSQVTKQSNEANYGTAYVNPLDPRAFGESVFEPIETPGAQWVFDGNNNELRDFSVDGSGAGGLFAAVQDGQVVRNTILVDPYVHGSGPTGALCGELFGAIENSGVHLDIHSVDELYKTSTCVVVSDTASSAGGLVGRAEGQARINRSYAAINVVASSAQAVGGLVGAWASSGGIDTCYASGEVDGASAVGGLVGQLEGGSIAASYATSDVFASGSAGGLVGEAPAGSIADSNAYGRVNSLYGGGFVGVAGANITNGAYLSEISYNDTLLEQPEGVQARDYATLADMQFEADHSFPYKESLLGKAFPFAPVLNEHWGNWPAPLALRPILAYYELYGDGSYGFYGSGQTNDGLVTIDTLDVNGRVIYEDGYVLLSTFPISGFEYSLNGGPVQRLVKSATVADGAFVDLNISSIDYWIGYTGYTFDDIYVYQLPFELQMPSRSASALCDTLELTFAGAGGTTPETYTYYYNPDFAKLSSSPSLVSREASQPATDVLYIRTPRQLSRLAKQPAYWAPNVAIAQDYDIDVPYYTRTYFGRAMDYTEPNGAYGFEPIGRLDSPFYGTYDGKNYAIIDYQQQVGTSLVGGMFGFVQNGIVMNTHMAASSLGSASVERNGSVPAGTLALGALVGRLESGTVSGCSISGYTIEASGSSAITDAAVGGLVGVNEGQVSRCSAANVSVRLHSLATSSAVLGVGGLVGGTSGLISESYAVENTLSCPVPGGSGRTISYGGIAGVVYGSGAVINNSYGYTYVDGTTSTTTDTIHHYDVAGPAAQIQNCYRLNWSDGNGGGFTTGAQDGAEVVSCTPDQLKSANVSSAFAVYSDTLTYGSAYYYDSRIIPGHLVSSSYPYPYPVVCADSYGSLCHYGFDWVE